MEVKKDQIRIMRAIRSGAGPEQIAALVDSGCEIDERDEFGRTALHLAGDIRILRLLVERGGSVSIADNQGNTPLHEAVACKAVGATQTLLEFGADPNVPNHFGRTPLHNAFQESPPTLEMLKTLLKAKANPTIKDKEGNTAIDQCKAVGGSDAFVRLLNAAAKDFQPGVQPKR